VVEEVMVCGVGICMICVMFVVGFDGVICMVCLCVEGLVFCGDCVWWEVWYDGIG